MTYPVFWRRGRLARVAVMRIDSRTGILEYKSQEKEKRKSDRDTQPEIWGALGEIDRSGESRLETTYLETRR